MTAKKLFFLSLLSCFGVAFGVDMKEIKFKSRDLEKVKAELNEKQQERERLKKEAEGLLQSVKESESKIKNVETSLLYTKEKNSEVERRMAGAKIDHDQLLDVLSGEKAALRKSFQTYYVASLLTSPQAPEPVFLKQLIRNQIEHLDKSSSRQEEVHRNLQFLIETQQLIRGEVLKQEEKLNVIRSGRESQERLLNKKKTRQEVLETELRDLQKTAEELESLIDVLRSHARAEAETEKESRRQKQTSGISPIFPHSLPWPVDGKVVTRFGRQQHPALATTFVSNGIVIVAASPQPVLAVADGKVLYAGEFMSYGPMTVIEHPGDWYTVYGHLSHWAVEKGQEIKKGDTVGVGRLRAGGGFEAYFELRFYGKITNPLPWLQLQTQ